MLANECTKFLLTISYWPHPGVKQAACSITWTQIIHFKNYEGGGGKSSVVLHRYRTYITSRDGHHLQILKNIRLKKIYGLSKK